MKPTAVVLLSFELLNDIFSLLFQFPPFLFLLMASLLANRVSFKELFLINYVGAVLVLIQNINGLSFFVTVYGSNYLAMLFFLYYIVTVTVLVFFTTLLVKCIGYLFRNKLKRLGL